MRAGASRASTVSGPGAGVPGPERRHWARPAPAMVVQRPASDPGDGVAAATATRSSQAAAASPTEAEVTTATDLRRTRDIQCGGPAGGGPEAGGGGGYPGGGYAGGGAP